MGYFITRSILLFVILFVDISVFDVEALRDMEIKVPEAVRINDSVTLACDYDLESAALYTIKWYRYEVEFYRYVPKESPPSKVFVVPHLTVDVAKSNQREVTLTNVDRQTAGEFKCEVSADAPLFHTDIRAAHLLVAEIPTEKPVLRPEVQKLAPGARVRANCSTPGSFPLMNITWFINDVTIHPSAEVEIHSKPNRYDALPGLETVRSTIAIKDSSKFFKGGKVRLRCLATIFNLYNESRDAEILEDSPKIAQVISTPNSAGSNIVIKNNANVLMLVLLLLYDLHAWLRRFQQ